MENSTEPEGNPPPSSRQSGPSTQAPSHNAVNPTRSRGTRRFAKISEYRYLVRFLTDEKN